MTRFEERGERDGARCLNRRSFLQGAIGAATILGAGDAIADPRSSLVAHPPTGFTPMTAPGRVVRVSAANTLQPNGLWPKEDVAARMLERAMAELTGKADLGAAFARFVHPDDKVAIKPNGIAGQKGATMATNKELILAVVKGLVAAGVPAGNIVIYEQWPKFMAGTRVTDDAGVIDPSFPQGVRTVVHKNEDATMSEITVASKATRFVRPFTEATAVINVTQIKDHAICGYTGCLKNVTHGSIVNPQEFHAHKASPQIAKLFAQDIVRSRVRLHITDGFKLIYDEGPLDTNKKRRVPHEAVYVSTDPVAQDVIGWGVVEEMRKDNALPTLRDAGREPSYIRVAGELGLGLYDKNDIHLREVRI